ncbi:hypothetical protein NPIL_455521 [Nephila pilipes]|uniref:Uncharacterized protein n=1 Tax=Nephila pilipes TaxID=299642 RepID=A0A8X6JLI4_NEPPI|nr:hypothetical protein NPIL_455521 [Nephila pilipes]
MVRGVQLRDAVARVSSRCQNFSFILVKPPGLGRSYFDDSIFSCKSSWKYKFTSSNFIILWQFVAEKDIVRPDSNPTVRNKIRGVAISCGGQHRTRTEKRNPMRDREALPTQNSPTNKKSQRGRFAAVTLIREAARGKRVDESRSVESPRCLLREKNHTRSTREGTEKPKRDSDYLIKHQYVSKSIFV